MAGQIVKLGRPTRSSARRHALSSTCSRSSIGTRQA